MIAAMTVAALSAQEINEFKVFNLTFNTFDPQEVKLNRGRVIWKERDFSGFQYELKYYSGQSIFKLDSNLTNLKADIDGDYVVWNTADEEIKLFNVRDWTTTVLDNSYNPDGLQPVAVHNGYVVYARSGGSGTEIVLKNLNSGSDTTFAPALWNRQPDVHHGQAAWVGSGSPNLSDPSDIYYYDGVAAQNLTNSVSDVNQHPILRDGRIAWLQDDGASQRVKLFTGDTTLTLAEPGNATTLIQGYDLSNGAAIAALTDTSTLTSEIVIYDPLQQGFTDIAVSDSVSFPHIDNRLAMWVEGRRQSGPQIKAYRLDTQTIEERPGAYEAVVDDEEFAWTFGEAVELGRPVTYEQMTSDGQNGWEQSRFKPLDDGSLVWGNFDNSADMRLFYNDGNSTVQLTDSSVTKDFVMANDGYVIWRHNFDFLWMYDGVNPPVQVVDSIQLENPYTAGGFVGLFGFYLADTNMIRYPFLYDIQSGTLNQLRQNDVSPWTVMCEGNTAVWQEGFMGDIVFYDGSNIVALSDSATDSDYSYRNGVIAWSERRNGVFQIMMYEVASGNTIQLTNATAHQVIPVTDGEKFVWFENANFPLAPDDSLMWYYDIQTGELTRAAKYYRRGFKQFWLSNGKIGWWQGGDVFVYDGQSITRLTNRFQQTPDVFVDREMVVWRETPNPTFQNNGEIFRGKLQPRVAFDALNITGDAPLTVQFYNRSWQGDQTYQWNFGDGNGSPEEHPSHTYQDPGVYSVTLTVTGPTGTVSEKKYDLIRVTETSAISTRDADIPGAYALYQNYPNPFNPSTGIDFDVARPGLVTVRVFDVLGREVKTLANEKLKPGRYKVQWDGTNNAGHSVASGVYLYRLIVEDEFIKAHKMFLLK